MGIAQFLADERVAFETLVYPPAYTAQRRAEHLGVSGRTVIKCVLLKGPEGYLVAMLPAAARVNTAALAKALEGPVQLADHADIARVFGDCEWGVTMPFGSRYGLPTFLEASLAPDDVLVMPSHFHHEALRLTCRDFEALERPRRLSLAWVAPREEPARRPN